MQASYSSPKSKMEYLISPINSAKYEMMYDTEHTNIDVLARANVDKSRKKSSIVIIYSICPRNPVATKNPSVDSLRDAFGFSCLTVSKCFRSSCLKSCSLPPMKNYTAVSISMFILHIDLD